MNLNQTDKAGPCQFGTIPALFQHLVLNFKLDVF
jgi:hypothetical protein